MIGQRISAWLFVAFLLTGCGSRASSGKWVPAPTPPLVPGRVSLGLTTWNLERFDGAGKGDETFPTRTSEQLSWMARILLDTHPDIIALQEISPRSPFSSRTPLEQLVAEMNAQASPGDEWKGWGSADPGAERLGGTVCLLWNSRTVERVAFAELTGLRVGYREGVRVPLEDLRFPRIPPAARFRSRRARDFDLTVIGVHLKASGGGFEDSLDANDIRRRGELEDLLGEWVLRPDRQGKLGDKDVVILGDFNERAVYLVRLLDQFGTRDDTRERLVRYPDALDPDRQSFLFAGDLTRSRKDYTWRGNAEAGQEKGWKGKEGIFEEDVTWARYTNVIDHVLISGSLVPLWDGEAPITYFEESFPLSEHVHFSDHRPVSVRFLLEAAAD